MRKDTDGNELAEGSYIMHTSASHSSNRNGEKKGDPFTMDVEITKSEGGHLMWKGSSVIQVYVTDFREDCTMERVDKMQEQMAMF